MIGVINDSQNTEFLPGNMKHADRLGNPDGEKKITKQTYITLNNDQLDTHLLYFTIRLS